MLAAGLFASALIIGFIVLDWWYFGRPESESMHYGCPVASMACELSSQQAELLTSAFGPSRVVALPHGAALWFGEQRRILLKPDCRRFASRFRTAWPLKGSITVAREGERLMLRCAKRMPWSSAVVTAVWFLLVSVGTMGFVVSFALQGGLQSMGSLLLGLGVLALGLLVMIFGLVTVSLAYKIENGRLMQVWSELQQAIVRSEKG